MLLLDESETERNTFAGASGTTRGHGEVRAHQDFRCENCQVDEQHGFKAKLEQETERREAHQSGLATTRVCAVAPWMVTEKKTTHGRLRPRGSTQVGQGET